jgi:hypothetical protein
VGAVGIDATAPRGDCSEEDCTCENQANDYDVWMNRLVRQIDEGKAPQWVRDALAEGKLPRSVILVAYLKWDRERSASMAYS